jgi:glycosyltransferase involved in cell wall biosynthesis
MEYREVIGRSRPSGGRPFAWNYPSSLVLLLDILNEMNNGLSLDIVVASYNRADMLSHTLHSILRAKVPPGIALGVIVADNNSTDATRAVVHDFMPRFNGRLRYIFERRQGKSWALNTAIAASEADLIGMIDDDEEIDANWVCEAAANFRDASLDFLGGPYLPQWRGLSCPDWLPESHRGLIGWIVPSDRGFTYGRENRAYLVGGNAVIRRRLFDKAGLYHTKLGRFGMAADGGEDLEIYHRFIAAGGNGRYSPKLIIHHHIHADRLRRGYFRKRTFWDGVGIGFISRTKREPGPHIVGIPRHFVSRVVTGLVRRVLVWHRPPADRFADELRALELAGRLYGRFLFRRR